MCNTMLILLSNMSQGYFNKITALAVSRAQMKPQEDVEIINNFISKKKKIIRGLFI
jgi:hypothetical protein